MAALVILEHENELYHIAPDHIFIFWSANRQRSIVTLKFRWWEGRRTAKSRRTYLQVADTHPVSLSIIHIATTPIESNSFLRLSIQGKALKDWAWKPRFDKGQRKKLKTEQQFFKKIKEGRRGGSLHLSKKLCWYPLWRPAHRISIIACSNKTNIYIVYVRHFGQICLYTLLQLQ